MQALLKSILETFFHMDSAVRLSALQVIRIILRQGLIHPAQVSDLEKQCSCTILMPLCFNAKNMETDCSKA